jgi:hypothetical protein
MKKLFAILAFVCLSIFAAEPTGPVADTQPEIVAAPEQEATIETFQKELTPHGVWIEDVQYGRVFRPNIVITEVEWRPYVHGGHWVWTNCGWYWASDYAWGNYTFHYGRWFRHAHHSWVWVPDYTWGPAWVSWRECDEAWGWAALPPSARFDVRVGFGVGVDFSFGLGVDDFVFVGCRDFLRVRIHNHCLPRHHCHRIYGNTTIIQNTYIVRNKTIINHGVSHKNVERLTNRKISETRVERGHVRHEQKPVRERVARRQEIKKENIERRQNIQKQRIEKKAEPRIQQPPPIPPVQRQPKAIERRQEIRQKQEQRIERRKHRDDKR